MYAITRTVGDATALGKLRFDTWREAMNYATTANLDAPDRMEASYGVVKLCGREDAAPDLLEACRAALPILHAYIPPDQFDGHAARALVLLRDALAKAEGGG